MNNIIEGHYSLPLVTLSLLVVVFSSLVAISLVTRLNNPGNSPRRASSWTLAFGLSLGSGIWGMHFIAMQAFQLPVTVHYDVPLTVASLLLAVLCCSVGVMPLRSGGQLRGMRLWMMGTLVGVGIAGMHYTGMAAMRMQVSMHFLPASVLLALVVAIVVSSLAFWIANRLRQVEVLAEWRIKLLAAIVMGLAVASMHYLAMWGTRFYDAGGLPAATDLPDALLIASLAVVSLLVQASVLAIAALDQAMQTTRALRKSERRYHRSWQILQWENEASQILEDILRLSMSSRSLPQLLEASLDGLLSFSRFGGQPRGCVFLWNADSEQLEMVASHGLPEVLQQCCAHITAGHCLCGRAAVSQTLMFVPCVDERHEIRYEGMKEHGHYCIPVYGRKHSLLGVLNCYVAPDYRYRNHDRIFLERVSSALALVIERKQLDELLQRQARHDPLTGLPNRTLLFEQLSLLLAEEKRYPNGGAVMFIDLDKFKPINDTLGHEVGDELLREVAVRIRGCIRSSDLVARIGGDEFVVVVSHLGAKSRSAAVAKKLLAELSREFILAGEQHKIGCSIGIAEFPGDGMSAAVLIRKADEAMYAVKHTGRNAWLFYHTGWTQRLSMFDVRVDAEHQKLLRLTDELNDTLVSQPEDRDLVLDVFSLLQQETLEHFAHEETLMLQQKYPDAGRHHTLHQEAIALLIRAGDELRRMPLPLVADTGFAIKEAIVSHLLKEDTAFIDWLQRVYLSN